MSMTKVEDIKDAIKQLSPEDFCSLRWWMNRLDDDDWDRQMREDIAAGRLDHLIEEARREIRAGRTKPGP